MRTDPRVACANETERRSWAFLHDLVSHPFMALSGWCKLSLRFHDWTSTRAWPRPVKACAPMMHIFFRTNDHNAYFLITQLGPELWSIEHPEFDHALRTKAPDYQVAGEIAERWFDSLKDVRYRT